MSNINVSILISPDEAAWQAYVNFHPDATIYHTLEWRDILCSEYRYEPVYMTAKEGDKIVGILPMFLIKNLRGKRLVSLPFSIYGGPIGDKGEVVSALIEKSVEIVRNGTASSLEIRPQKPVGDDVGLVSFEYGIGTTVDLSVGENGLWKGLTDRNDINRAVREGLNFRISDCEGIERFYSLQLMTRKRLGLPIPRLAYYRSFFERMQGLVKLALVEKEGVPVAGGIFFAYKHSILYALGASDYRYLQYRPNDMLLWKMMKWGCENDYKTLDLGPTPLADKGLTHFKRKWGGKEASVMNYYFPVLPKDRRDKAGNWVFKVAPQGISSLIGRHVLRYFG